VNAGATRVAASYHWRDAAGSDVVWDGRRSRLAREVPPGGSLAVQLALEAPAEPGDYTLILDLVREHIDWFSVRDPGSAVALPVAVR
jgi:hypothetical protein